MKDEIKEILEFKEDADYKRLSVDEIVILKDYITNLQEELESKNKDKEINRLRAKQWQIKNLKEEWLDIKENTTLVFENNNLIEFMNKLETILQGEDKDE